MSLTTEHNVDVDYEGFIGRQRFDTYDIRYKQPLALCTLGLARHELNSVI